MYRESLRRARGGGTRSDRIIHAFVPTVRGRNFRSAPVSPPSARRKRVVPIQVHVFGDGMFATVARSFSEHARRNGRNNRRRTVFDRIIVAAARTACPESPYKTAISGPSSNRLLNNRRFSFFFRNIDSVLGPVREVRGVLEKTSRRKIRYTLPHTGYIPKHLWAVGYVTTREQQWTRTTPSDCWHSRRPDGGES